MHKSNLYENAYKMIEIRSIVWYTVNKGGADMGFGKLLEEKMKLRNIRQSELSEAVGIPKTTLNSMIAR